MTYETIKINNECLPKPDSDLKFSSEKVKKEFQTAAGTTVINVVRPAKLSITGTWTLSGTEVARFRRWQRTDAVEVSAYYPDPKSLSEYICQFEITAETHITDARIQIPESDGIYQISVNITEL